MNTFAVVFLCIQACLVQNVFSQCARRAAVAADPGFLAPGLATPFSFGSPFAYDGLSAWGGIPAAAPCGLAAPLGLAPAVAPFGYPAAGFIEPFPYGGIGEGNVAVSGELPVAGNTAVVGQVPIMGAVSFGGVVPAAGAVSITGQCSCGLGAPYDYYY